MSVRLLIFSFCVTAALFKTELSAAQRSWSESCMRIFFQCVSTFEPLEFNTTNAADFIQCLDTANDCHANEESYRNALKTEINEWLRNAIQMNSPDCNPSNCIIVAIRVGGTRFQRLVTNFECLQNVSDGCPPQVLYARDRLAKTVLGEMARVCPDCPKPTLPPAACDVTDVLKSDILCYAGINICNAEMSIRNDALFETRRDLLYCLANITDCYSTESSTEALWRFLASLPPDFPDLPVLDQEPATCNEALLRCSVRAHDHLRNSSLHFNTSLLNAHNCAAGVELCDCGVRKRFQLYLLHQIRKELDIECPECQPSYAEFNRDETNQVSTFSVNDCRDSALVCRTIFNIRPKGEARNVEMRRCLIEPLSCSPAEIAYKYHTYGFLRTFYP